MDGSAPSRLAWVEPGVFPVTEDVYRIPLPLPDDGLRAVNVYAIDTGTGVTLIDSGWALVAAESQLASGLAELGYDFGDVQRFLVTHAHRDHYTQAVVLRDRFGMHIDLGIGEQATLDALVGDEEARSKERIADLRRCGAESLIPPLVASWELEDFDISQWRYPDGWIGPDAAFQVGDRTLDALATPGHTQGHVVFRDAAAGVLFAGDHILPHITPSIGFEAALPRSPLADYLDSLALVLALPDTALLPAHGPVTASTHARIHELLEHHRVRLDHSRLAVAGGSSSVIDVARVLRWTRRERTFDELSLFDRMLAITETAAHLEVLVAAGTIVADTSGEVTCYSAPTATSAAPTDPR